MIDVSEMDANSGRSGNQKFDFVRRDLFTKTAGELRLDGDGVLRGASAACPTANQIEVVMLSEADSRPVIRKALYLGINFFDTANVYSDGSSEEMVGRALKDFVTRGQVVITTKNHGRTQPRPNAARLSRKAILHEIEGIPATHLALGSARASLSLRR